MRTLLAALILCLASPAFAGVQTGKGATQMPVANEATRDAIASPSQGLILYDSTHNTLAHYDGSDWRELDTSNFKSYNFAARPGAFGTFYVGGFYDGPAADADLTQASTTVNLGSANHPYAAHAFIVASGAGSTDGSDLVLTVTGTSITDAGVRNGADSEVIIGAGADLTQCQINATSASTDLYCETTKKWLGQVTYTLSSTGGTTFSFTFNYGLNKYEDWGNRDFVLTDFECTGLANANDSGFNIVLIKQQITGWTYNATAFVPGGNTLLDMNAIHSTESDIVAGEQFAFKRASMSTDVTGSDNEGLVVKVVTGSANSVSYMACHIGVLF